MKFMRALCLIGFFSPLFAAGEFMTTYSGVHNNVGFQRIHNRLQLNSRTWALSLENHHRFIPGLARSGSLSLLPGYRLDSNRFQWGLYLGGSLNYTHIPGIGLSRNILTPEAGLSLENAGSAIFMRANSQGEVTVRGVLSPYRDWPVQMNVGYRKETLLPEDLEAGLSFRWQNKNILGFSYATSTDSIWLSGGFLWNRSDIRFRLRLPSEQTPSVRSEVALTIRWGKRNILSRENNGKTNVDPTGRKKMENGFAKLKPRVIIRRKKKTRKIPFAVLIRWGLSPKQALAVQRSGNSCSLTKAQRKSFKKKGIYCDKSLS